MDHSTEQLGGFVVSLVREVLLPHAVSGEALAVEGLSTMYDDLVDMIAGTAQWLPTLTQPTRELLLHVVRDASNSVPALAEAVNRLCVRGIGGGLLALRYEERRLKLNVADAENDADFLGALHAEERELQTAVRLGSVADGESYEASKKALQAKGGEHYLHSAAKGKLLLTKYASWLAGVLRKGKNTLEEALPGSEPVRVQAELMLSTKPLSLTLFVMQQLFCSGGPGMILKLLALPTDVSSWVPVAQPQRRQFQTSKKRSVVNPFSLLIELKEKSATKEYTRIHNLVNEVKELRSTDAKRVDKIIEAVESLGTRDGVRSQDNAVVTSLVAASYVLKSAKAKMGIAQRAAYTRSEEHRRQTMYGKDAPSAAKTEEYLQSSCEHAMIQLVSKRFESQKLREIMRYVLGGCDENALLPSSDRAAEARENEVAALFNDGKISEALAASEPILTQGERRKGMKAHRGGVPRGVEVRRGPGEGFVAGLNLGVYLAMRVASHAATSFWAALLYAPGVLSTIYVPTMAGDEFAMILAASDFVGWYKCPNVSCLLSTFEPLV
uniref:Uncharacterized protein n=1 Tax=uncultured organism MedDCM-OCT-S12-C54 TaxID=743665 RepID=D6PJF6_9ZZZZ|nr:hypothetical protein [uncultured organism MedDCM-OCT-S12-C54]